MPQLQKSSVEAHILLWVHQRIHCLVSVSQILKWIVRHELPSFWAFIILLIHVDSLEFSKRWVTVQPQCNRVKKPVKHNRERYYKQGIFVSERRFLKKLSWNADIKLMMSVLTVSSDLNLCVPQFLSDSEYWFHCDFGSQYSQPGLVLAWMLLWSNILSSAQDLWRCKLD